MRGVGFCKLVQHVSLCGLGAQCVSCWAHLSPSPSDLFSLCLALCLVSISASLSPSNSFCLSVFLLFVLVPLFVYFPKRMLEPSEEMGKISFERPDIQQFLCLQISQPRCRSPALAEPCHLCGTQTSLSFLAPFPPNGPIDI